MVKRQVTKREALDYALNWVWSCRLQIERFQESTGKDVGPPLSGVEIRRCFSRTSYDEHMILVAAKNLVRALERVRVHFPGLRVQSEEVASLLRDIYEHWDEHLDAFRTPGAAKKRSAKKFADKFPTGKPWTVAYTREGIEVGGVLNLRDFLNELQVLEDELLPLEDAEG